MDTFSMNIPTPNSEIWDPSTNQQWASNLMNLSYPDPQYPNITDEGYFDSSCMVSPNTTTWEEDLLWRTPQSWTLPESESVHTSDSLENSSMSDCRQTAITTPSLNLSEIDWDSIIDDEATLELHDSTPIQNELEDSEDWAWMKPRPSILPITGSTLIKRKGQRTSSGSDICSTKEESTSKTVVPRKPPCQRNYKEDHNAIERKYRENINVKFTELDQWLLDHPSSSDPSRTAPSKKMTKCTILITALERLQYLSRSNRLLEEQRRVHKRQIAGLKRIVKMQRKQVGPGTDALGVKSLFE